MYPLSGLSASRPCCVHRSYLLIWLLKVVPTTRIFNGSVLLINSDKKYYCSQLMARRTLKADILRSLPAQTVSPTRLFIQSSGR